MSYVSVSPKPQKTIISSKEECRALMKSHFKAETAMYGFYTSVFDRIIKDEEHMVIPIFDRQFHRAHSIFDTLNIVDGHMLLFEEHLSRLEISCKLAQIPLPMPLEKIKEKITDLASFCISNYGLLNKSFHLRYWVSSGGNNFNILPPKNKKSNLYVIAFEAKKSPFHLIKEYSIDNIMAKRGILANSKTTNYLINSLYAIESNKKGGIMGIMLDQEGYILEGPVANVAFVFKNNDFVIPPLEKTLKGTTLMECIKFIETNLIKNGKINSVIQRNLKPSEVYENAKEMMFIGGDFIIPIGTLDDRVISKEIGPIGTILNDYLKKDLVEKSEKVPLDRYKKPIPHPKL